MSAERRRQICVASAFAFLAGVFLFAQYRDSFRAPHRDEVEYLHAALRMARGERIFVDFLEHHSPLFFAMFEPFAPERSGVEATQAYVTNARWLIAACDAVAIAMAALLVWRASRRAWAPVTMVALVFSAGGVWRNGLGDVRAESPGLALWWSGAALVLLAKRPAMRGLGLGLLFLAVLVSPKWPFASVVVGVVFLVDLMRERRGVIGALFAATLPPALGVLALLQMTDLRRFVFFVFQFSSVVNAGIRRNASPLIHDFFACPWMFRLTIFVPAAVLLLWSAARIPQAFASARLPRILLAIAAASLAEIIFLYPYPAVDFRYYAFWVVIAAAILALAIQSAEALLRATTSFNRLAAAIPIAAGILALIASIDIIAARRPVEPFWISSAWLERHLAPGETLWMETDRHPIGAADAHYYWFGYPEVVPTSLYFSNTPAARGLMPPLSENDLPPCRIEAGLDPHVRFIAGAKTYPLLKGAGKCFERLRARGAVEPTPVPDIWRVR